MVPTDRASFVEYCLRKLGKPVIEINVDDDQIDDRIDESIQYYRDYHMDASNHVYYKYQITSNDVANRYITLPDNIIGAVRIFQVGNLITFGSDIFNVRYQIALNELYTLTSVSLIPYFMAMEQLGLIQEMLTGQQPIRFSKHSHRLYIDMDWARVRVGEYLVVEAFEVLDPSAFPDIWADRWLQNYCTAKIKYQWGINLTKFTGVTLPGGISFNGERILSDADNEIARMEAEMLSSYSIPPQDFIG